MKSTGIRVGTKEAERQSDRLARQWLQDGIVIISRATLREYFLDLWNPDKSEYLKSKQAETGRTYSKHYIYNSQLLSSWYTGKKGIRTYSESSCKRMVSVEEVVEYLNVKKDTLYK